jgi:ERF superfamily
MKAIKEMTLMPQEPPEAEQTGLAIFERLARDPSVDVDKLERLVQMHERAGARLSQEQFNAAMSLAQTDMRPVAADADNPQTRSKYASYSALDRALRPIYTKHGFGLSFDTGEGAPPDWVRVLCYVTHAGGHARTYHADMPADGKGAKGGDVMTRTHAVGAAMSYGMRYLLKMIFNVAVGEDDQDGNAPHDREEPAIPDGFDNWLKDLYVVAEGGGKAVSSAWGQSKQPYRDFATKYRAGDLEQIRRKARGGKQ